MLNLYKSNKIEVISELLAEELKICPPPINEKLEIGVPNYFLGNWLREQINYSKEIGFDFIELHTGKYAELSGSEQYKELQRIIESAHLANDLGLVVNAGHGLNYNNVKKIASINNMNELNIGHSIVARALAIGLEKSVREMKSLITSN